MRVRQGAGAPSAPSASRWTSPTRQQVEACFAKTVALLGQVDILVSNAGIQSVAPIEEFDFGKWRQAAGRSISTALS